MSTLARQDLAFHVARVLAGAGLLLVGAQQQMPWLALAGGVVMHLAAFTFTHEVAHGALGIPRKVNEWVLAVVALPMLVAGHTNRVMHLRHHANASAAGDIEGMGGTVPFWKAVLQGPMNTAQFRMAALQRVNARERNWQLAETALTIVLALLALWTHSIAGAAFVVANVFMQLTATAWASHLPHRPPRLFMAIAKKLLWMPSALIASFVFHEEHHARPKVPCAQLVCVKV